VHRGAGRADRGRAQLTCMMEATGRGASPLDAITRQMTEASFAGIKGHCDRAQIDDDAVAEATYNPHIKRAEERYQRARSGAAGSGAEFTTPPAAAPGTG
jgi:hypothetical protein